MGARLWQCCGAAGKGGHGGPSQFHPETMLTFPPPTAGAVMLGCQDLAGLDGEGKVFPTGTEASLSYLCFSLGSCSLAKPSSFPCPCFSPCVGHTWLRGASVTSVHLHPGLAALQLLLGPSWALGKRGARSAPHSLCCEEGTAEPLPGLAVAPVPCDMAGPCPAPPGLWAGGWQLCAHVLHSRQEGRRREAEVLCCSTGAWGRFWAEPSFPLCVSQRTPSELMGLGHTPR